MYQFNFVVGCLVSFVLLVVVGYPLLLLVVMIINQTLSLVVVESGSVY
jgi:hypothetical protein